MLIKKIQICAHAKDATARVFVVRRYNIQNASIPFYTHVRRDDVHLCFIFQLLFRTPRLLLLIFLNFQGICYVKLEKYICIYSGIYEFVVGLILSYYTPLHSSTLKQYIYFGSTVYEFSDFANSHAVDFVSSPVKALFCLPPPL